MRTHCNAKKGTVIETRGCGNAPGAGGVISTVIVTDPKADGHTPGAGGHECRDATTSEISQARASGNYEVRYG